LHPFGEDREESKERGGVFHFLVKEKTRRKEGGRWIFVQSGPAKLILLNVEEKYEWYDKSLKDLNSI
jgi:hypothetical protein